MSPGLVRVEHRGDVAAVILESGKVNALSEQLLIELGDAVEALHEDLPGAVVLTGGDRVFAAGADIGEFGTPEDATRMAVAFRRAFDAVERLPRVTIASIAGYALGGGLELALACDLRVGSARAVVGMPEILLGIIPGAGGTQRLPRLVGAATARHLMLTGRQVAAEEARTLGLLDEVVAPEELDARVQELAEGFARGPLVAQALVKQAVRAGADLPLAEALDLEARLFVDVFSTEDARLGIESFRERGPGKATFTGR